MVKNWVEKPIGELFDISGGLSASRAQLSTDGYPYLHYGDIHGSTLSFVDVCTDRTIPRLKVPLNKIARGAMLQDGDIVFVDASEDDEGASRHVVVRNIDNKPFISGLHTIVAKAKTNELDNLYREYCFQTKAVKDQFRFYAVGTKVVGVNKTTIKDIIIPFAVDTSEQRRIAEALSDTDMLITAVEKLIAKKRAIKQGAMQELLTGKRRLPGFSGEWVETTLGDICEIKDGTHQTPKYVAYGVPFYSVENVTNNNFTNTKYISFIEHRVLTANYKIERGDILMTRIGSIGVCKYVNWDVYASFYVSLALLKCKSRVDARFLSLYSQCEQFQKEVELHSLQHAIPKKINLGNISLVRLSLPTFAEQTAIAEILSDMDAEIDSLTAKLNKIRHIKQGMMSELLTGRIRLAEQETIAEVVATPKVLELPKREPKTTTTQIGGHNQHFDDAVMIAGIVNVLYSDRFPLGRKKVQKCLYLLRRHQDENTATFKKKAAGPYADKVRYKGGEPIARSSRYIATTTVKGKGTTFARGSEIEKALGYIKNWGKQADIQWVADKLKYKKVDELELLATVDMAICDLSEAGIPISVDTVKHLIATNKEWRDKLKKQIFDDSKIAQAICDLEALL